MVFSSLTFLFLFLPITLLVYYIVPDRFKNAVALLASIFFYAWGEPVYVVLMVLSILFNYFSGLDIENNIDSKELAKKKVIFAVVINVLILIFFKYYGFFIENFNAVMPFDLQYRELPLPIGISFYTFQALSYIIDVYRKKVPAQQNIINFALYISMFPQLIAGPIVRYEDIAVQIESREHSKDKFGEGTIYFIIGLAKKVILANSLGGIFENIESMSVGSFSVLTAWVGVACFAFHIYFDFSGYSDMAIGLGKMLGFDFKKNFDYPYVSKSITEFWRRWHISLGTWFREYVYIPLGGNKGDTFFNIRNLMIVWMLTGIWHGAAWNFVMWGLYYGVILCLEKFVWGRKLRKLSPVVQHIYAIVIIMIGWVLFFSDTIGYAFSYLGVMFGLGASGLIDKMGLFLIVTNWLLILFAVLGSSKRGYLLVKSLYIGFNSKKAMSIAAVAVYVIMFLLTITFLVTESYNPFLYFRF